MIKLAAMWAFSFVRPAYKGALQTETCQFPTRDEGRLPFFGG